MALFKQKKCLKKNLGFKKCQNIVYKVVMSDVLLLKSPIQVKTNLKASYYKYT